VYDEEGGERAVLTDAVLTDAVLTRADLTDAVLTRAVLTDAVLTRAVLTRAVLTRADLTDAVLTDAVLTDADLTDAVLTRAVLTRAVLTRAVLRSFKTDFWAILLQNTAEIPGLLAALKEGRINGTTYEGECACLVGTIANVKKCDVHSLERDSLRPAERWFLQISKGMTPETSGVVKLTVEWVEEFLALLNQQKVA
jgi:uncharacterized protein YjbI with pentapeptide repeats